MLKTTGLFELLAARLIRASNNKILADKGGQEPILFSRIEVVEHRPQQRSIQDI